MQVNLSMTYPCGSATLSDLPHILKSRFEGYDINILSDEELQDILPMCNNKRYRIVVEEDSKEKSDVLVGFSVTTYEYSETPQIVRITKICSC